jgi:putative protein kinase ArgK-like GTPase of G3E family
MTQYRTEQTARNGRRRARHQQRLRELISVRFLEHLERTLPAGELDRAVDRITTGEIDTYSAAAELMARAVALSGSPIPDPGSRIPDREPRIPDPGSRT